MAQDNLAQLPEHDTEHDLQAHDYTGLGPEAIHKSEIISGRSLTTDTAQQIAFRASVGKAYTKNIDKKLAQQDKKLTYLEKDKSKTAADLLTHGSPRKAGMSTLEEEEYTARESKAYAAILEKSYGKLLQDLTAKSTEEMGIRSRRDQLQADMEQITQQMISAYTNLEALNATQGTDEIVLFRERRIASQEKRIQTLQQKLIDKTDQRDLVTQELTAKLKEKEMVSQQMKVVQDQLVEFQHLSVSPTEVKKEISRLKKDKETAKERIQNAHISTVSKKDYDGTANGILLDGVMYLGGDEVEQAYEDGITTQSMEDNYEMEDVDQLKAEQELADQFTSSAFFKSINSENLMEYATYDDSVADFKLMEKSKETDPAKSTEEIVKTALEIDKHLSELGINVSVANELDFLPDMGEMEPVQIAEAFLHRSKALEMAFEKAHTDRVDDAAEAAPSSMLSFRSHMREAIVHAFNTISDIVISAGMDALIGLSAAEKADNSVRTGSKNVSDSYTSGLLEMFASLLATGGTMLDLVVKLDPVISHDALATWSLGFLKILDKGKMTGLGVASASINIAKGLYTSETARRDKNAMRESAADLKGQGLNRLARTNDNAAVEKAIKQFEGYVDMANGGTGMVLAASGIGGLITLTTIPLAAGIKKLGGSIRRSSRQKEILNDPEILGGMKYDTNRISKDHFNEIMFFTTGIKDKDSLYEVIKIVDSIDLHRAMRASAVKKNPQVDQAMAGMGFPDPAKYPSIRLADIQKRTGASTDWVNTLHEATEVAGMDYNTAWTHFMKAFNRDHYKGSVAKNRSEQERRRYEEKKANHKKK